MDRGLARELLVVPPGLVKERKGVVTSSSSVLLPNIRDDLVFNSAADDLVFISANETLETVSNESSDLRERCPEYAVM